MKHGMLSNPESEKKYGYDRWELEEALRTLMRAAEIVGDQKLFAAVQKEAAEQAKVLGDMPTAFAGLRSLAKK